MIKKFDRKIVLEDGSEYHGYSFGAVCDRVCEIVFDTSMVGYQEILSDPSYAYQMVTMTYPIIGNYGVTDDDYETKTPTIGGLIVREYNDMPSNFRYTKTLSEVMSENNIPGIYGVDTRKITRNIREHGTQKVIITDVSTPNDEALRILRETELSANVVSMVTSKKMWYSRTSNHRFNVVAVDCGIKLGIIRNLNTRDCNVTIVPCTATAEEIDFMKPDGVLISNGPGNPENVPEVVEIIRELRGRYPVFGIGLGHQLISLAYGARTYKMKFGHHGGNHPVRDLNTGRIEIAGQNHCYAVDAESLTGTGLEVTHVNVLDGTVEGAACAADKVFTAQYYPERVPGSQDNDCLFDKFVNIMEEAGRNA